ncbi:MAG TPA: hypothetical protein VHX66_08315 [Solirubrobacteraceae bacterium]|jgi:hypothetical protein|nr:hypothetical protein [Solirubrobacteraceae bacterium]
MSSDQFSQLADRQYAVRPYNQRMAKRVARRAHVDGEDAVAVAFTFNNLATSVILGAIVDIVRFVPIIGSYVELAVSIFAFYFHRIVLVTDQNVYVFRDWPFHIPGKLLMKHPRGPGVVQLGAPAGSAFMRFIRRGQLTFQDGTVVYHSFVFIRRAQYIAQEANLPVGQ